MLEANALTTVERVRMMLGIEDESEEEAQETDALLEMLINRASAWVEGYAGRKLGLSRYTEWHDADGQQELVVDQFPIVDVEYVLEDGEPVDPATYSWSQTGEIGVIYRDFGWSHKGYPRGLADDPVYLRRCLEVSYSAGYVLPKDATEESPQTLPADLEGLVWDMVGEHFADLVNGATGLDAFKISDVSWSFNKSDRAVQWMQLAAAYRRY